MSQIRTVLSGIVKKDAVIISAIEAVKQFVLTPMEAHEDIFGGKIVIEPGLYCFLLMLQQEDEFQLIVEELGKKKISLEKAKDELLWSISENCGNLRKLTYERLSRSIRERIASLPEKLKPS